MNRLNKNNDWNTSSGARSIKDSNYRIGISRLMNRIHSASTIYIMAGVCQIVLGLAVITSAVLGYVRPLWLSTMLTVISSISTMIGSFLVYHTISKMHDPDLLLRNAMKRVMELQN